MATYLPSGLIFLFDGLNANIPSGFSRATKLDGRFPKGTADGVNPNVTGGNNSHSHSAKKSHSHTVNGVHTHTITVGNVKDDTPDDRSGTNTLQEHNHGTHTSANSSGGGLSSVASTYSSASNNNRPPYHELIFIKSNGTYDIPANGVILTADNTARTGYNQCDGNNSTPNLTDKFPKAPATSGNAGGTGGATSHNHVLTHTHSVTAHSHANTTSSGVSNPTFCDSWGGSTGGHIPNTNYAHTHTVTTNNASDTISATNPTLTLSDVVQPLFKKLMAFKNTSGSAKGLTKGDIALWIGTLASIPSQWRLCDGGGGTPDMRSYFLKITNTAGDIGTTGGANTHSHASVSHGHSSAGHNHTGSTNGHTMQSTTSRGHNGGYTTYKYVDAADTHYYSSNSVSTQLYNDSSTTSDSQDNQPEFLTVAFLMYMGGQASAKARIKSTGVTKTASAKARIEWVNLTNTATARARIEKAGVTKTARARAYLGINPSENVLPNRVGKIDFGFGTEMISAFRGFTDMPEVALRTNIAQVHLFDELERLNRYKLSGGSLQTDIRTDRYIWGILDDVYSDFYLRIASCDTTESWSTSTDETTNQRQGDGCQKLTSSGADVVGSLSLGTMDITDYTSNDYLEMQVYVEDPDDVDRIGFTLYANDGLKFEQNFYSDDVVQGWNSLYMNLDDIKVGDGNYTTLYTLDIVYNALVGTTYVMFDDVKMMKWNCPHRVFDVGLQNIPVAWWAGNTALYEIKTACEAEGARFYADENGYLTFESRQHYNNNDEHKVSVLQLDFNKLTDLEYSSDLAELINKVTVKLKPRKVGSETEIWRYGAIPSISASGSLTVWATFNDPCPTTSSGIVTPVATTDYTANTQADGGGTNKTAQISISITKFSTSAKLVITNNDAATVYLTLLKLRGTPAVESDEFQVIDEDTTSIGKYGVQPEGGYVLENKYMADQTYAETVAQQLLDWYAEPVRKVVLKNRAYPQLQIGDMITVKNDDLGDSEIMRIIGIKESFSSDGFWQDITARSVTNFELLNYFEIGTSEIGGSDVIST